MIVKRVLKSFPPVFNTIIFFRYFFYRFFCKRKFKNIYIYQNIFIDSITNDLFSNTFFGYYNITPENTNGDILFLKVAEENVRGSLFEPASIMIKRNNGSIQKLAETKAWNWQQGCMLQWYPGRNDQILYNDYDHKTNEYISKVIDTNGDVLKIINQPVNNVSKCGQFALSLNYARLSLMRPDYGYFNKAETELIGNNEDGILYIDLINDKIECVVTLEELIHFSWTNSMEGAMHKVNHIDINPSGSKFMFLHRWIGPKGRYMRLFVANSDGNDLKILNGDKMTSHCCWLNDNEILSFCNYKGRIGYFKFNIISNTVNFFSEKMPEVDGHPSISPDGKWIITDTYPNRARFSMLYLYNIENDTIEKIGQFHQPLKYTKEMRVDLHPKWGPDSKTIYLESAHSGHRRLYSVTLKNILD